MLTNVNSRRGIWVYPRVYWQTNQILAPIKSYYIGGWQGLSDPPITSWLLWNVIMYLLNDLRFVEKRSPSSNRSINFNPLSEFWILQNVAFKRDVMLSPKILAHVRKLAIHWFKINCSKVLRYFEFASFFFIRCSIVSASR